MSHDFDTGVLERVAHRAWPMPEGPWLMTQTWNDLLFAHWPVDADQLRLLIPHAFQLDLFEGRSWIGIVPFTMTNVSPRGVPLLPWVSEFPELNVRTYVTVGDRPGVYFFSLDAGNALAVKTARALLNLPYCSAAMNVTRQGDGISYDSRRTDPADGARFEASYRPAGSAFEARRGSLEYFLTERYCLYNIDHSGRPYRLEIHHPPWALQHATAEISHNTMGDAAGMPLPAVAPLLHFAKRQDTIAWAPQRFEIASPVDG
jgi:uncharacterized protein YqjF (DUF2071 family)